MSAQARSFVLRTPLLPFEALVADRCLAAHALASGDDLDAAIAVDRRAFWARVERLLDQPEVLEALGLASHSFAAGLAAWQADPTDPRGAGVERTLVRYLWRMTSRATPFGLFAGCTVGVVSGATELRLSARSQYRRATRLRRSLLLQIVAAAPPPTALRTNPTIHRPGLEALGVRYIDGSCNESLAGRALAVTAGEGVERLLRHAVMKRERHELAAFAVQDGASPEEAEELLDTLVASRLLLTDDEPPLTGDDPCRTIVRDLVDRGGSQPLADCVTAAVEALDAANASAELAWPPSTQASVRNALASIPGANVTVSRALSVSLYKPAQVAALSGALTSRIDAAARALAAMGLGRKSDPLRAFKRAFCDRFEAEEVPLLAALDREVGVGAAFDESATGGAPGAPPPRIVYLLGAALADGQREIILDAKDGALLARSHARALPAAYAAVAQIRNGPDGEHIVYLQGVSGPSGGRLLGRFAHEPSIRALLAEHLRSEESLESGAIFAEVVYAASDETADAIVRPSLRSFEIPCFTRSAAPPEQRIELADLCVSVRSDRVVLRSARLGKRVVPRGTHAHQFASSPVLAYRFLGHVQEQGVVPELAWDWGALGAAAYLPRVVVRDVVVSLARWRLSAGERQALSQASGAMLFRAAATIRAARRLPRWVSLLDGDRSAWIDFDDVISLEAASHSISCDRECVLQEVFAPPDATCVTSDEGRFAHEIVIPFVSSQAPEQPLEVRAPVLHASRLHPPGSEWLYARLEAAESVHDRLLVDVVAPVLDDARNGGAVASWFFVRHTEPTPHLRVRFRGHALRLCAEILPALAQACAPHLRERRLARLALDTYVREVERYGGERGIDSAERIFHVDSQAVLKLVLSGALDEPADRWRSLLVGVDRLLQDLRLDLAARSALTTRLADACRAELGTSDAVTRRLDLRFRAERERLEALRGGLGRQGAQLKTILDERSRGLAPIVDALDLAWHERCLLVTRETLATSLVHMHVGRMFCGALRHTELHVYDLLRRLYRSELARRKKGGDQCSRQLASVTRVGSFRRGTPTS